MKDLGGKYQNIVDLGGRNKKKTLSHMMQINFMCKEHNGNFIYFFQFKLKKFIDPTNIYKHLVEVRRD